MTVSQLSLQQRLTTLSDTRQQVYKLLFMRLEGWFGQLFYRRAPPTKGPKRLLNLGCGDQHFAGWVNADFYRFSDLIRKKRGLPDWMLDAAKPWKCEANYWDWIHTEHTLEHIDYAGVISLLKEAHRTLKPGHTLRVVLPGVEEALLDKQFAYRAEAIGSLTQTHGHVSAWDAKLLCDLLLEIGFSSAKQAAFRVGADQELIKDLAERADASFYVEARK